LSLVISYNTFVAIQLETSTTSPYKDTGHNAVPAISDYGQSWSGSAAFLPLSGDESLQTALNFADLPLPEYLCIP
jgi:hypothetical protein